MKTRLVIFDLDGTLLNTIGDLAVSCNHMLALRNLPQHTYEQYCMFVGNGILRLVERALPEQLRTAEYVKAARQDFLDHYIDHIDIHTRPYDGIEQVVRRLRDRGVKLAVASNKFQAGTEKLIRKFFPDTDFVAVYGQREGVPLKPDTQVVDTIISQAGVGRPECVMVGDSCVDMQTAHNAGITAVGVSWGFRPRAELEENRADYIADTAEQLTAILESL